MSIQYRNLIIGAMLCAALALSLWPAFYSPAVPMDEGMVLLYPDLLLKGWLPYRNYESITGPGNPMILAAAYSIFGTDIFVERAMGLVYRLLILLAVFGIAQRWGTLIAAGCAFMAAVLLGATDLWANTWYAGIAFALCSLWVAAKVPSSWRSFFGGFLAGIAAIVRCDLGPALMLALLSLFLAMNRGNKIRFLIGGVIGLLPLILVTVIVGPSQAFYSLFIFPVFQLNPGRHLPIAEADRQLIYTLAFQIAASVLNIAAGIFEFRRPENRDRGRLLLGAAILGLICIHYTLERFDSGHVLNGALVALSFLPLSIFCLSKEIRMMPKQIAAVAAIIVSIGAFQLLVPTYSRYFYRGLRVGSGLEPARQVSQNGEELEPDDKGIFITRNGRRFAFGFQYAADEADKILTELERVSVPGQRLFVGPGDLRRTNYCDTYIYYLEPQLVPATYFLEMDPAAANAPHSRLPQDIASADWLILNRRWDFLTESNQSMQLGSLDSNLVVQQNFDLWLEHGSYLLCRNKKLANAVVPGP